MSFEGLVQLITGALVLVMLITKKRRAHRERQQRGPRRRRRRHGESPQFEREYDPIEPS